MNKNILIILFLLPFATLSARPQTRAVECDSVVSVSMEHMNQVIARFAYEFQACPDSLFSWAYRNTDSPDGKHKEVDNKGKDAVRLVYKDRTYNPNTRVGDVALDIYVLGSRMFRDNHLGTVYTHDRTSKVNSHLLTATYSGALLENGHISFRVDSIAPEQVKVHYCFDLTLGKFLSTFVSDKIWRNVAEWRFRRVFYNLIEYAETGEVKRL